MKRIIVLFFICSFFALANGQTTAYRGGNYTGIYGVFENPASIVSNPRNWDVNLFSIRTTLANDKVSVGLGDLNKDFEEELFEGKGQELSGFVNVEVVGPSFMFKVAPKHAIAFTSRARILGNIGTLDTKLAQAIKDAKNISSLPYTFSCGNQRVALNAWSEIGVSWGGVLWEKENHLLKLGATLKYLRGVGNSFTNFKDLRATLNADMDSNNRELKPYLSDGRGEFLLENSGVDLFDENFEAGDLRSKNGSGVGFDLGVVYEYRNNKVDSTVWCGKCLNKGYKFKIAASLVDLGRIKYDAIAANSYHYKLSIAQSEKFYLENFSGSVKEIEKALEASPYAIKETIDENYSPSLPTTFNLVADYYWGKHFFTEVAARLSLVDESKPENAYLYNSFTFVPRFEGTYWGIALPLNYNEISEFNAGLTLRMGPLMIGSGSAITSLLSEGKQADLFVGIRFGF